MIYLLAFNTAFIFLLVMQLRATRKHLNHLTEEYSRTVELLNKLTVVVFKLKSTVEENPSCYQH